MRPIYDKNVRMVGWYDEVNQNIFDNDMQWIGFIKNQNYYNTRAEWGGIYSKGTFTDRSGRPITYIQGASPMPASIGLHPVTPIMPLKPLTPLRPLTPISPMKPMEPIGGWSEYKWEDIIRT